MISGVDQQMTQYNRWFARGCPVRDEKGWDGKRQPALSTAQPPVIVEEE